MPACKGSPQRAGMYICVLGLNSMTTPWSVGLVHSDSTSIDARATFAALHFSCIQGRSAGIRVLRDTSWVPIEHSPFSTDVKCSPHSDAVCFHHPSAEPCTGVGRPHRKGASHLRQRAAWLRQHSLEVRRTLRQAAPQSQAGTSPCCTTRLDCV